MRSSSSSTTQKTQESLRTGKLWQKCWNKHAAIREAMRREFKTAVPGPLALAGKMDALAIERGITSMVQYLAAREQDLVNLHLLTSGTKLLPCGVVLFSSVNARTHHGTWARKQAHVCKFVRMMLSGDFEDGQSTLIWDISHNITFSQWKGPQHDGVAPCLTKSHHVLSLSPTMRRLVMGSEKLYAQGFPRNLVTSRDEALIA